MNNVLNLRINHIVAAVKKTKRRRRKMEECTRMEKKNINGESSYEISTG